MSRAGSGTPPPSQMETFFQSGAYKSDVLDCLRCMASPMLSSTYHLIAANAMYDFDVSSVEPYVQHLVCVVVTHKCDRTTDCHTGFKKYFSGLAGKSTHVALQLLWALDAVTQTFEPFGLSEIVRNLKGAVETAAVNQRLPKDAGSSMDTAEVNSFVQRMQWKCTTFNQERAFVAQLTNISQSLRTVDRSQRKDVLRQSLRELNEQLLSQQVYVPICDSNEPARSVLRVIPEECVVFSSRERAPYLLRVEVLLDPGATNADARPIDRPQELNSPVSPTTESLSGPHALRRVVSLDNTADVMENKGLLSHVFGESPTERKERLRRASPYGHLQNWDLQTFVVKAGDDLRQEELALRLINEFNTIWQKANVTLYLYPYMAITTSPDSGIIECVTDATSVDSLKKAARVNSLQHFFTRAYGGVESNSYTQAQRNFVESMAGYSVVCYLLQIKDRHNGNLLLTRSGHLVHIDFGFMLCTSPGGVNFESAPFKLSMELVEAMGGVTSSSFAYFKLLLYQGFVEVRKNMSRIMSLVELMMPYNTIAALGTDPTTVLTGLRNRFHMGLDDTQLATLIKQMVENSVDNWRTRKYDQFQTWQNGIV